MIKLQEQGLCQGHQFQAIKLELDHKTENPLGHQLASHLQIHLMLLGGKLPNRNTLSRLGQGRLRRHPPDKYLRGNLFDLASPSANQVTLTLALHLLKQVEGSLPSLRRSNHRPGLIRDWVGSLRIRTPTVSTPNHSLPGTPALPAQVRLHQGQGS